MRRAVRRFWVTASAVLMAVAFLAATSSAQVKVRVGHMPNITHAQALVGRANKAFANRLGNSASLEWKGFSAGPLIIEAVFAGAIDIAYVGPSPAISGYLRSQGEAFHVIAGATSGGAALVVRADAGISKPEDFHGKKVATPQYGNTQDVALRAWLDKHGLKPREKGGDVQVIPIANPDQLSLFQRKQIDAAWAPEPWASRLIQEAGGRLFLDERDDWPNKTFATTLLIVSRKFANEHPDAVKKFVGAHVDVTQWITNNPAEAKRLINEELARETGKPMSQKLTDEAFSRIAATVDPARASVATSVKRAADLRLLKTPNADVAGMFELKILNQVLAEKHLKAVQ